jgi:cytochrome c oxidase subunit 2
LGSLGCLLWVFSAPAAAQSVNRAVIDDLNTQLLYVALPLTVFVEVILVYAVVRFRDNDDPKPTIESPPLEITWTAATAIILLFVGVSAYVVLTGPYVSPAAASVDATAEDETIRALGYQWGWQFSYPDANVTTRNELVIPANESVTIRLRSADVLHALFVPRLGVKKDAFPGEETIARTNATREGTYRADCTELCGEGHSRMQANVTVVDQETYTSWLSANQGRDNVTAVPAGRQ